ncbi:MAG: sodium/solute symporter [Luminiphilus sp.]|nr:sodium/solute symporter [Luminiphilus sp.]
MFSPIDWMVVAIYIGFTTWIGHYLKGQQETPRDFFLGGRRVPWYAVSASIIATTISAVTFIGVPAIIYASGGNFTYLQLAIGGILARILIARYLIPRYYEQEFYSPYDFMTDRLGPDIGRLTAGMFILGGILGQSVRVYATALVLELLTGWSMGFSILVIALFAILWTWMGGVAAVIWTDFIQFFILVAGGIAALIFMLSALPDGWWTLWEIGRDAKKFQVIDLSTDPRVAFTFWAALIALPFQGVAVYGTDHLFTQRLLCCKNAGEARKALLWSIAGESIPALMLLVGAGLFAFYSINPMTADLAQLVSQQGDRVFPIFIIHEMPVGIRGLLIAGILSAAISSLDSILAALSQISLTMFYRPFVASDQSDAHYLSVSRLLVVIWGLLLGGIAVLIAQSQGDLITLAFSMTTYTLGPMLGLFLLSLISRHCQIDGIKYAVPISMLLVLGINEPELLNPMLNTNFSDPLLAWPWLFPIGTLSCLILGVRLQPKPSINQQG